MLCMRCDLIIIIIIITRISVLPHKVLTSEVYVDVHVEKVFDFISRSQCTCYDVQNSRLDRNKGYFDANVRFIFHAMITIASQSGNKLSPQIVTLPCVDRLDWTTAMGYESWTRDETVHGSVIFTAAHPASTPVHSQFNMTQWDQLSFLKRDRIGAPE